MYTASFGNLKNLNFNLLKKYYIAALMCQHLSLHLATEMSNRPKLFKKLKHKFDKL